MNGEGMNGEGMSFDMYAATLEYIKRHQPKQDYAPFIDQKRVRKIFHRILKTLIEGKSIAFVGDYDADGFFSSLQMRNYIAYLQNAMKIKSGASLHSFFSDRSDGYTMPKKRFQEIQKEHDLVIFFDTGSSYDYLDDTVENVFVIDHHPPSRPIDTLPDYIFNPGATGELSTSNGRVVFEFIKIVDKFLEGMNANYVNQIENVLKGFAAITLVSDVAKRDENNRRFISEGLAALNASKWMFFVPKIEKYRIKYPDLSFSIINKINSMSRMNHNFDEIAELFLLRFDGKHVYNMLDAETFDQKWKMLEENHAERKRLLNDEHEKIAQYLFETEGETRNNIVIYEYDGKFDGLNGLIAQYLFDRTGLNAFSVSYHKERGCYVGSGRGHNVIAAAKEIERLFPNIKYGGHQKACGINFEPEHKEGVFRAINVINDTPDPKLKTIDEHSVPFLVDMSIDEVIEGGRLYVEQCGSVPYEQTILARVRGFDVLDLRKNDSGWNFALLGDPVKKRHSLSVGYKQGSKNLDDTNGIVVELFSAGMGDTIFLQSEPVVSVNIDSFYHKIKKEKEKNIESEPDFKAPEIMELEIGIL